VIGPHGALAWLTVLHSGVGRMMTWLPGGSDNMRDDSGQVTFHRYALNVPHHLATRSTGIFVHHQLCYSNSIFYSIKDEVRTDLVLS
jgi:hypothetical protein